MSCWLTHVSIRHRQVTVLAEVGHRANHIRGRKKDINIQLSSCSTVCVYTSRTSYAIASDRRRESIIESARTSCKLSSDWRRKSTIGDRRHMHIFFTMQGAAKLARCLRRGRCTSRLRQCAKQGSSHTQCPAEPNRSRTLLPRNGWLAQRCQATLAS